MESLSQVLSQTSPGASTSRLRPLYRKLYRLEEGETIAQVSHERADEIRKTWTLDDGYAFVELLRALGSQSVAAQFEARMDVAKARGATSYEEAMGGSGKMTVITNAAPIESDEALLRRIGVPPKYATVKAETFDFNTVDKRAYAAVAAWRDGIQKGEESTPLGLELWSATPGNGKTTLATLAFKGLVLPKIRRGERVRAQWHNAAELFAQLRSAFSRDQHADGEPEAPLYVERLIACDVLMIDDLGKERPTEWVLEQLYRIIEARHKTKPTILTSNLSPSDLEKHMGAALASRLADGFAKLRLSAEDYRRGKGAVA